MPALFIFCDLSVYITMCNKFKDCNYILNFVSAFFLFFVPPIVSRHFFYLPKRCLFNSLESSIKFKYSTSSTHFGPVFLYKTELLLYIRALFLSVKDDRLLIYAIKGQLVCTNSSKCDI